MTWERLHKQLSIPHFSHTKKMELVFESDIPTIYNHVAFHIPIAWETSLLDHIPGLTRLYVSQCPSCFAFDEMKVDMKMDLLTCHECGHTEIYQPSEDYILDPKRDRHRITARTIHEDFGKRLVHFRFWLRRLQGKEFHHVTSQVVEEIRHQLIKDNYLEINYWNIRSCLKKMGYQRFYDHAVYIMSELRGIPLVKLTPNQESILCRMFLELKPVFPALKNRRVNMLSYPYVIKKLCEIKGWTKMAKIIPTLKSPLRVFMQDQLWKDICKIKKWTFIPTTRWTSLMTHAPNRSIR